MEEPHFLKIYAKFGLVLITSAIVSRFLKNCETERMSLFRDKSALFGRELKPGEPPSWP